MGLKSWIYNLATQTSKSVKKTSILDKLQTVEGQSNHYIWNGCYIELGMPQSTISNGSGVWFYTIHLYSENEGKGEQIGAGNIKQGDREDALTIASAHIDGIIIKETGLL